MKTFRVYYKDGNQRLFEAKSFVELMYHLINYDANNLFIYKIEEAED